MNAETKTIRILAADDHALLRQGIASLIDIEPDMELVAQAATRAGNMYSSPTKLMPPSSCTMVYRMRLIKRTFTAWAAVGRQGDVSDCSVDLFSIPGAAREAGGSAPGQSA